MLTRLKIRNFKRFDEEQVEIELGNPVVFIGPNNSGKTTAMQALALWDIGLKRWNEKRSGTGTPEKRPGVAINRRDLVAIPTPAANLLWHNLRVRDVRKVAGKNRTDNIRIDIIVEGVTDDRHWTCGLEFDYANDESFYCRPLRLSDDKPFDRMTVPDKALVGAQQIAFLPPMSGLAANETHLPPGAVDVRIGEGRTAEVLRNLCYQIHEGQLERWGALVRQIRRLFGAELNPPDFISERGEISMSYRERGVRLDLSSSGRGLQQTLLLLAYMYANPGAVLLLDEPDAHLEILRQREIYSTLTEVARESGSQIIAASHSEVLLRIAARQEPDKVIAFVGKPHRLDSKIDQVLKALKTIGYEQYYLAAQTGWVLYLEGSTDLSILQAFARRLKHKEAMRALERPFVYFVRDRPVEVQNHYFGLKEACPALLGVALFDRLDSISKDLNSVKFLMWKRREIENYICSRATLEAYAAALASKRSLGPLFKPVEVGQGQTVMRTAIEEMETSLKTQRKASPWGVDSKVSDEFLRPLFANFFEKLGLQNRMTKKYFYELVEYIPEAEIVPEISEKLDAIARVAEQATPECGRG